MGFLLIVKIEGVAAVLALAAAGVTLSAPKGEALHIAAGRFHLCCLIVALTAGLIAAAGMSDAFAEILILFAAYFAQMGWRWASAAKITRLDRGLTAAMLIGSMAMVATAAACLLGGYTATVTKETAPMVAAFGIVGTFVARRNFIDLDRTLAWPERLMRHGFHMAGAMILLGTAFTVGNAEKLGLDPAVALFLPLLLVTPGAVIALRRFFYGKGRTV